MGPRGEQGGWAGHGGGDVGGRVVAVCCFFQSFVDLRSESTSSSLNPSKKKLFFRDIPRVMKRADAAQFLDM